MAELTNQEVFAKYEKQIKELYINKNLTASEVCNCLGIKEMPQGFAQKLHRQFPKNLGWGGARQYSGNKKGVKLKN